MNPEGRLLCAHFTREITVLSDGRVTTCCVDSEGLNAYADIHHHVLDEVLERQREMKRRFLDTGNTPPGCRECLTYPAGRPFLTKAGTADEVAAYADSLLVPRQFVLEATARCNARCSMCIHHRMENDLLSVRPGPNGLDLDLNAAAHWLMAAKPELRGIRLYNYGEPLLNKGVEEFCRRMTNAVPGLSIGIATNGTAFGPEKRKRALIRSGVTNIIVSLHGADAETSRKYLGPAYKFDLAIKNLREFVTLRREMGLTSPRVIIKCVLFAWNDSDEHMQAFRELARDLGVDGYQFIQTGGVHGTKRFPLGSAAWDELVRAGLNGV